MFVNLFEAFGTADSDMPLLTSSLAGLKTRSVSEAAEVTDAGKIENILTSLLEKPECQKVQFL